MLRRSLLALLVTSAALPITRVLAQDPPAPPAVVLTPEQTQLITDIQTYNSSMSTMAGRFLQIDTQGARIEGTFYIQRPGLVRFRYNPPSKEEIISTGKGFYVIDRGEKTYIAYPQDKVPLRQFLDQNIDLLDANIVAVSQTTNYLSVTLSDDTPKGTVQVALIFDVETKDLVQWVLIDPSGSQLTFSLYDLEKNVEIPPAYFYIGQGYAQKQVD